MGFAVHVGVGAGIGVTIDRVSVSNSVDVIGIAFVINSTNVGIS